MAIVQKKRDTSASSSPKIKHWKPPKKEKLFRRKLSASNAQTISSYDKGAADSLVLSQSIKPKRTTVDELYNNFEAQSFVMARAKEVQENLSLSYPSFIKVMYPSHVAGGFWLGLPRVFCDSHLPKQDSNIVLEDESGRQYEAKYLFEKIGLSAGWRGFSIAHKLLQGDVVVFHLVMPNKFMVYIVRTNAAAEVVEALPKYEPSENQMHLYSEEKNIAKINNEATTLGLASSEKENIIAVKNEQTENPVFPVMNIHAEDKQTSGIRLSDKALDFEKVRSSNDFSIFVNGLIIDSEFPKHLRTKYYDLCCSQRSYLHGNLLEGLNYKLVSGIISETVNIADAIRAFKITTSKEHLATWDTSLKAFQGLGMNVGFLRSRIDQLMNLPLRLEKKREAELKRDSKEEEVRMLEMKLLEARKAKKQLKGEIQRLDFDIENMEKLYQEVAGAPW